jgi:hypothetical protein
MALLRKRVVEQLLMWLMERQAWVRKVVPRAVRVRAMEARVRVLVIVQRMRLG